MKQPGVLVILLTFVAAVSFVVASEQYENGRTRVTALTGLAEVETLGDADGTGSLKFSFAAEANQICYELAVSNIGTATAADIRFGTRQDSGPVVATLEAPVKGSSKNCVSLTAEKLADITRNPGNYYVNVASVEFPKGAIRGQLGN